MTHQAKLERDKILKHLKEYLKTGLPSKYLFNEPWMNNIDFKLLYRYWFRKDTNKVLLYKISGINIYHVKTEWGVFRFKAGVIPQKEWIEDIKKVLLWI